MRRPLFTLLISCALLSAAPYHIAEGAKFGEEGAEAYARARHGGDGALFLDPYILDFLKRHREEFLIDIGCGAGPWAIEAAKLGCHVAGVDLEPAMIERALLAAAEAGVVTFWKVGDAADLPFEGGLFDAALSVNIGCCLRELKSHLREAARVVKEGGALLVTAPASFDTLFTDDSDPAEIERDLASRPLGEIASVYRATFVMRGGERVRLQSEAELQEGEPIWRKIPGLVVPNYYHSERAYLDAFEEAGFEVVAIHRPCFSCEQERIAFYTWNQTTRPHLGSAYVGHPPFLIVEAVNRPAVDD